MAAYSGFANGSEFEEQNTRLLAASLDRFEAVLYGELDVGAPGTSSEASSGHRRCRMPDDRQVCRPVQDQCAEWTALRTYLRIRGHQLVASKESGVQWWPMKPLPDSAAARKADTNLCAPAEARTSSSAEAVHLLSEGLDQASTSFMESAAGSGSVASGQAQPATEHGLLRDARDRSALPDGFGDRREAANLLGAAGDAADAEVEGAQPDLAVVGRALTIQQGEPADDEDEVFAQHGVLEEIFAIHPPNPALDEGCFLRDWPDSEDCPPAEPSDAADSEHEVGSSQATSAFWPAAHDAAPEAATATALPEDAAALPDDDLEPLGSFGDPDDGDHLSRLALPPAAYDILTFDSDAGASQSGSSFDSQEEGSTPVSPVRSWSDMVYMRCGSDAAHLESLAEQLPPPRWPDQDTAAGVPQQSHSNSGAGGLAWEGAAEPLQPLDGNRAAAWAEGRCAADAGSQRRLGVTSLARPGTGAAAAAPVGPRLGESPTREAPAPHDSQQQLQVQLFHSTQSFSAADMAADGDGDQPHAASGLPAIANAFAASRRVPTGPAVHRQLTSQTGDLGASLQSPAGLPQTSLRAARVPTWQRWGDLASSAQQTHDPASDRAEPASTSSRADSIPGSILRTCGFHLAADVEQAVHRNGNPAADDEGAASNDVNTNHRQTETDLDAGKCEFGLGGPAAGPCGIPNPGDSPGHSMVCLAEPPADNGMGRDGRGVLGSAMFLPVVRGKQLPRSTSAAPVFICARQTIDQPVMESLPEEAAADHPTPDLLECGRRKPRSSSQSGRVSRQPGFQHARRHTADAGRPLAVTPSAVYRATESIAVTGRLSHPSVPVAAAGRRHSADQRSAGSVQDDTNAAVPYGSLPSSWGRSSLFVGGSKKAVVDGRGSREVAAQQRTAALQSIISSRSSRDH